MDKTNTGERPFRVLSLDGGGMRGLYSATVLEYLVSRCGGSARDIGKGFDLIVGTSTGGILASALAAGAPVQKIIQMYIGEGQKIFSDPMPERSAPAAFWTWVLRNTFKAAGNGDQLKAALTTIFGEETLGQLYQRRQIALCLTSMDLVRETARVFKTGHIPLKNMDDALSIVEVCLATSAAPVFFPLAFVGNSIPRPFVDGGLWANNPVLIALIEALELTQDRPIEIISIGTCPPGAGSSITGSELNRGLFGWDFNTKTVSVSMNAQASGANFAATFLSKQLSRDGRSIRVIRLPQGPASTEHAKYLKLDQSCEKALTTFRTLGEADAISAFQMCQDPNNVDGQTILNIFSEMPLLKEDSTCSIVQRK